MESCWFYVGVAFGACKLLLSHNGQGRPLVSRVSIWKKVRMQSRQARISCFIRHVCVDLHQIVTTPAFTSGTQFQLFSPLLRTVFPTAHRGRLCLPSLTLCGQTWFITSESLTLSQHYSPKSLPSGPREKNLTAEISIYSNLDLLWAHSSVPPFILPFLPSVLSLYKTHALSGASL